MYPTLILFLHPANGHWKSQYPFLPLIRACWFQPWIFGRCCRCSASQIFIERILDLEPKVRSTVIFCDDNRICVCQFPYNRIVLPTFRLHTYRFFYKCLGCAAPSSPWCISLFEFSIFQILLGFNRRAVSQFKASNNATQSVTFKSFFFHAFCKQRLEVTGPTVAFSQALLFNSSF